MRRRAARLTPARRPRFPPSGAGQSVVVAAPGDRVVRRRSRARHRRMRWPRIARRVRRRSCASRSARPCGFRRWSTVTARRIRRLRDARRERRRILALGEDVAEAVPREVVGEAGESVGEGGVERPEVRFGVQLGGVDVRRDLGEDAMRQREPAGDLERARNSWASTTAGVPARYRRDVAVDPRAEREVGRPQGRRPRAPVRRRSGRHRGAGRAGWPMWRGMGSSGDGVVGGGPGEQPFERVEVLGDVGQPRVALEVMARRSAPIAAT